MPTSPPAIARILGFVAGTLIVGVLSPLTCDAQIQLVSYFEQAQIEQIEFDSPAETLIGEELFDHHHRLERFAEQPEEFSLPATPVRRRRRLLDAIIYDQIHFYQLGRLRDLTLMAGVAAVLANTSADESVRDTVLDNITHIHAEEYAKQIHNSKFLGEGTMMLPTFAGAAIVGRLMPEGIGMPLLREWGDRSLRTVSVGAPPLLLLQRVLGASRPGESIERSEWQPFSDDNGVSGHAFMGAVPLLAAAMMADDPFLKTAFYVGSTLPAISRLTDDAHYPSQAILGWWIAFLAATSVDDTNLLPANTSIFPLVNDDGGMGLGFQWRL